MAKQFIRHLEFYGFPDQNGYSSEVNGISADLSEIIKKNKEQDKEIKDLTNEKANKKDLLELSGTVETLVSAQTEFNNMVVEELSGITNDINILKDIDNEYGQQLSALTDGLNDAMDAMQILGNRVDDVENNISGINETIDTIIEDYAKKDDVYSKEDIDSMIASGFSGYATQEWVEEQGYITEEEADAKYAKIEDLEDLASQVESAATNIDEKFDEIDDSIDEINDKVDTLTEDLSAFSEDVSEAISGINESINGINDSISGINDDIAEINEAVSANTADIAANTEAIEDIQEAVSGITSDIDALSAQVMTNKTNISRCADAIRQRATKDELSAVRTELKGDIENLDETKADKTDLDAVSGAVDTLSDRLTAEIAERREADRAVNETVAELNGRVTTAEGKVDGCVTKVDAIESGLTKEIADRKAADLALIGEDTDTSDADTIWGAKKKAAELATQAINESKNYTNSVVDAFEDELAELSAKTDQELSKFATQEYVDGRLTNIKTVLRSEIKNGDDAERDARIAGDAALDDKISTLSDSLAEEIEVINKNSTILNAFTDWDGEGEYDDSGNGIVDVMHREIHDLKPEGIEEIKAQVNANTEAIEGLATTEYVNSEIARVEEEIPSLETVYTKTEVDALIADLQRQIDELRG
jgi:DNA repair exonuclease SbcCD ATPase subunit